MALSLQVFWWRRRCHYKRFDGVITSISVALSLHADCRHCHYKRIVGIVITNVLVALSLQTFGGIVITNVMRDFWSWNCVNTSVWWRCHYKRLGGVVITNVMRDFWSWNCVNTSVLMSLSLQTSWWHCQYSRLGGVLILKIGQYNGLGDVTTST